MYIVRYDMCVCICMFVGEHVCRPSLLCNPVHDKIDNNNNNKIIRCDYYYYNYYNDFAAG